MERQSWTRKQYFDSPFVSSSMMRCYNVEGPLVAYHRYVRRDMEADDTKDWQRLGTAFHLAMEDVAKFRESFVVVPSIVPDDYYPETIKDAELKSRGGVLDGTGSPLNLRLERHRQFIDEQKAGAEIAGKDWLTAEEVEKVWRQVEAVWQNPQAAELLGESTHGNKEVPVTATIEGVECKGLIDILLPGIVVDFKTTLHRTREAFIRDAFGKGYQFQLAHYMALTGVESARIVTVTKEYPFEAMVYEFADHVIDDAMDANATTLYKIAKSFETGSWHTVGFGMLNTIGDEF